MTLLVGNLSSQVTEANLRELFTKFGRIGKIDIFPGADFATVALEGEEGEANEERAVQELNGVEKFGRKLKLFTSEQITEHVTSVTRDGKGGP